MVHPRGNRSRIRALRGGARPHRQGGQGFPFVIQGIADRWQRPVGLGRTSSRSPVHRQAFAPASRRPLIAPGAFLNIPYDRRYLSLYLAGIAGLCGLGLRPRAAIEIPGPQRRLGRVLKLLAECRYSFHDLSRVSLSGGVPRFNMPFELGLAVVLGERGRHDWFVLESRRFRLQRSLSDLNGTDPLIHDGSATRLLQALADVFDRPNEPDVPLMPIFDLLRRQAPTLRRRYGALYTRGAFIRLVASATTLATELRRRRAPVSRGRDEDG